MSSPSLGDIPETKDPHTVMCGGLMDTGARGATRTRDPLLRKQML
jgi:hypothetical protein